MSKIYILASTHAAARYEAEKHKIALHNWVYVDRPEQLFGVIDPVYFINDTFWHHPHAREIYDQLQIVKAKTRSLTADS